MSLNCQEIEKLLQDLPSSGKISKIKQLSNHDIMFNITENNNNKNSIFFSVAPGANRFHLLIKDNKFMDKLFYFDYKNQRFADFLEAKLVGGFWLKPLEQVGYNRIIQWNISKQGQEYILFLAGGIHLFLDLLGF